ncbi:CD276 antigen homolog [Colossoma macropomum]|uniref:CD276 antigen homolog n=1 Tax=Colossoma macropomum TaxID=42526 RepID=UPI0018649489|nr:CD276 antigen homolog [Colossoma macropomum]
MCVLVSLSAFLQDVESFVGDVVILPCSNSDKALLRKLRAFWRFRDSSTVYDVIESRASLDDQDALFRGRVDSFPDEWAKGNFSIKLSSVKKTDGGTYTCFLPAINTQASVYLTVKDTPRVPPVTSEPKNTNVHTRPGNLLLFLALLFAFHFCMSDE